MIMTKEQYQELLTKIKHTLPALASTAGDVPEWNKGGHAYETSRQVRSTLSELER